MAMYLHACLILYIAYAGAMRLSNPVYLQDAVDNQDGHERGDQIGDACQTGCVSY
jgi:hypothetical protein